MKLIYTDSNELTDLSWERIVHSLITYGKTIWINENITFSNQLPNWKLKHFINTFNELKDEGIIKLWNYEQYKVKGTKTDAIISIEDSSSLYEAINYQINNYNSIGTIGVRDISGIELTSKIIQYKHELWNIGIAKNLGVNGICYPYEISTRVINTSNYYKYEMIDRKYTNLLFNKFKIKPIGYLPTKDIIELRKKSNVLNIYLSKYINDKLTEIPPNNSTIEDECQIIFDNYQKELNELIKEKSFKHFGKDICKETAISAIGFVFSSLSMLSLIGNVFHYFKDKKKYSLLFFAIDVQQKALNSYNRFFEEKGI